jgi:hypothetical protein
MRHPPQTTTFARVDIAATQAASSAPSSQLS